MPVKNTMTIKRQNELIAINQVLAVLVVFFALSSGFLLALREEWFALGTKQKTNEPPPQIVSQAVHAVPLVVAPVTPLVNLLKQARYDQTITAGTLSEADLYKLVWAAQGKITTWGERTVPSYRSTFPLNVVVLVRQVTGIAPGLYWFNPIAQALEPANAPMPTVLSPLITGLKDAPLIIGVSTDTPHQMDTTVWNEAGGVAQNILLAAKESGLSIYFINGANLAANEAMSYVKPGQTLMWLMPVSIVKQTANTVRK